MESTNPALEVALAYHRAWTSKDMALAMSLVADDITCDAPAGRLEGAAAFRQFLEPFTGILLGSELFAAFGDRETAVLVYDTSTVPVASAPGAEWLTVRGGRIVYDRFIFDQLPFHEARQAT